MEKQEEFNGQIKAIFRGGRIHKIKWGDDDDDGKGWNSWSLEARLEYAMELASAMNQAADVIQEERNELVSQNVSLTAQVASAQKALEIQKSITQTQLLSGNAQLQQLSAEIQKLQAELKQRDQTIEDLRR